MDSLPIDNQPLEAAAPQDNLSPEDQLREVARTWEPRGLKARHLVMCEYHMLGWMNKEIAAVMGMHEVSVGLVLRSKVAQQYMQGRIKDLSDELHGQFHKVVRNMSNALDHDSDDVKLKATDMWLKAHGKYQPREDERKRGPISAEDVVNKLLENAAVVQVNIDNRTQAPPPADDYSFLGEK